MSGPISNGTGKKLSMSLPLLRANKDQLIELMEIQLRPSANEKAPFGQSEIAAMILVELLLDRATDLVEHRELSGLGDLIAEHRSLGLSGRHYSRFGDALIPVIKDIAGPNVPGEIAGAWGDAFWAIIRAAQENREEALA